MLLGAHLARPWNQRVPRARARAQGSPKGGEPNGAVGALGMILGAHLVRPWKSFISNAWRAVRQGGEAVPVPSRDAWSSL